MSERRSEAADCACPRTDGYRIKRRGCPAHAETDAAYWRDSDRRKFGTDSPHEPTDEFVRRAFAEGARALWPDSRDPGWIVTFNRWLDARVAEFQHNTLEMARKADLAERRAEESEFHVEQLRDARDSAERRIERADALLDGWEHDGPDDPAILLLIQRVREVLVGSRGEVGTGAGEGATGQDTGTAWVTRSEDCPEAPAQAHLSAADDSDAALCPCGEPIGHAHHCGSCCGCGAADQHEHMAMVEHLRRCPICDMRFDKECAACGCGLDGYGNCPCGCYGWDRCDHDWLDRPESDSRECLICGVEVFG